MSKPKQTNKPKFTKRNQVIDSKTTPNSPALGLPDVPDRDRGTKRCPLPIRKAPAVQRKHRKTEEAVKPQTPNVLVATEAPFRALNRVENFSIRIFRGTEDDDFNQWVDEFETKANNIDDLELKMKLFKTYMSGRARESVQGLLAKGIGFPEVINQMRELFTTNSPENSMLELGRIKRGAKEPLNFYSLRVLNLVTGAYPEAKGTATLEKMKIDCFLRGVAPEVAELIRKCKVTSLDQALQEAEKRDIDIRRLQKLTLLMEEAFTAQVQSRDTRSTNEFF